MTWQVSRFRIGLLSDSNLVESQIFALWEKRKRIIGKCFEISNWNVALGYLDFSNKEKFLELEGGTLFLNRRKGSLIFCSRRKINLFEADIGRFKGWKFQRKLEQKLGFRARSPSLRRIEKYPLFLFYGIIYRIIYKVHGEMEKKFQVNGVFTYHRMQICTTSFHVTFYALKHKF